VKKTKELVAARKYIDGVTDEAPVLLAYIDKERCYKFVSKGYECWFHREKPYFLGNDVGKILDSSDKPKLLSEMDKALSGVTTSFSAVITLPGEGGRFLQCDFTPDIDENGNVAGFLLA
jgi:hypothetical protein